jgi:predicted dehydrogenase
VKQVVQSLKTGEVSVLEVPPPLLRRGGALVASHFSLISAGTERSKIELGRRSLVGKARARPDLARQVYERVRSDGLRETYRAVTNRLESPSPLGYSTAGVVLAVGEDGGSFQAGDLVACAGAGFANHAEVVFVPKNLVARVPDGVSPAQAAYATLGAIAMQGVRQADVRLGERIAVIGLGVVGLLTAQLVRAAGGRVVAVDVDERACALARDLGADLAVPRRAQVEAAVAAFSNGVGVDAVIICASTDTNDPVELAGALARDRGRVVVVGAVGMEIPRDPYYLKELELRLSRSYGPGRYDPLYEDYGHDYPIAYVRWTEQRNMEEFLRLVQAARVDVDRLTTHRFQVDQAQEAYALLSDDGSDRPIGILLEYPDAELSLDRPDVDLRPRPPSRATRLVRLGVIGAGNFATRVLLPTLAADKQVELVGVASARGLSAHHAAKQFGFAYATSDIRALLDSAEIDAVVIATRHGSHASLVADALRSGKTVFCEKPLATDWKGLEQVACAYAESPQPLLVGFNRRFSPLVAKLREALPPGVPRTVICRVNAGPLPDEHWAGDAMEGGGRIVGELCHFLDLACFFAEGRPERVFAETLDTGRSLELNDSLVVQVAFADGSLASLQYLATGDPSVGKERIEVFAGGVVALIDDFRRLELARGRRRRRERFRRQEKGHREELAHFVAVATGGAASVLTPEDAFWTSALTLQVIAALRLGAPARVELPHALRGADA